MKKTFYVIAIFALFSQLAMAANYADPNDPNCIAADPNDPNDVGVSEPPLLPGEEDVVTGSSASMSLYGATELPELKYRLLPVGGELTDGDAAELYFQAVSAISDPNQYDPGEIDKWVEAGDGEMGEIKPLLELVTGASKCRNCSWDKLKNVDAFKLSAGLKMLTQILAVKAKSEIEKGEYLAAVETIRTGLAMARHIADSDSMLQGVLGVSTASVMLKQVEILVQSPGAPSMLRPLQDLPRPLVDLGPVMQKERMSFGPDFEEIDEYGDSMMSEYPSGGKQYMGAVAISEYGLSEEEEKENAAKWSALPVHVRSLMKRLDRFVAALECLEGVRYYASKYGQLPGSLSAIGEFQLPNDPVTGRPFSYSNAGGKAVLKSPVTENQAHQTSTIRYEFTLEK